MGGDGSNRLAILAAEISDTPKHDAMVAAIKAADERGWVESLDLDDALRLANDWDSERQAANVRLRAERGAVRIILEELSAKSNGGDA